MLKQTILCFLTGKTTVENAAFNHCIYSYYLEHITYYYLIYIVYRLVLVCTHYFLLM